MAAVARPRDDRRAAVRAQRFNPRETLASISNTLAQREEDRDTRRTYTNRAQQITRKYVNLHLFNDSATENIPMRKTFQLENPIATPGKDSWEVCIESFSIPLYGSPLLSSDLFPEIDIENQVSWDAIRAIGVRETMDRRGNAFTRMSKYPIRSKTGDEGIGYPRVLLSNLPTPPERYGYGAVSLRYNTSYAYYDTVESKLYKVDNDSWELPQQLDFTLQSGFTVLPPTYDATTDILWVAQVRGFNSIYFNGYNGVTGQRVFGKFLSFTTPQATEVHGVDRNNFPSICAGNGAIYMLAYKPDITYPEWSDMAMAGWPYSMVSGQPTFSSGYPTAIVTNNFPFTGFATQPQFGLPAAPNNQNRVLYEPLTNSIIICLNMVENTQPLVERGRYVYSRNNISPATIGRVGGTFRVMLSSSAAKFQNTGGIGILRGIYSDPFWGYVMVRERITTSGIPILNTRYFRSASDTGDMSTRGLGGDSIVNVSRFFTFRPRTVVLQSFALGSTPEIVGPAGADKAIIAEVPIDLDGQDMFDQTRHVFTPRKRNWYLLQEGKPLLTTLDIDIGIRGDTGDIVPFVLPPKTGVFIKLGFRDFRAFSESRLL